MQISETGYTNYDPVEGTKPGYSENGTQKPESKPANQNTIPGELSEEEKKEVAELKKIDRKVKQHEMAHLNAAAGINISGANFKYKRGPDGVNYAVGGDVRIDTSGVSGDPEATIAKAKKIARAALAPSDPSPQDRKVASKARQMESKARAELMKEKMDKIKENSDNLYNPSSSGGQESNNRKFVEPGSTIDIKV